MPAARCSWSSKSEGRAVQHDPAAFLEAARPAAARRRGATQPDARHRRDGGSTAPISTRTTVHGSSSKTTSGRSPLRRERRRTTSCLPHRGPTPRSICLSTRSTTTLPASSVRSRKSNSSPAPGRTAPVSRRSSGSRRGCTRSSAYSRCRQRLGACGSRRLRTRELMVEWLQAFEAEALSFARAEDEDRARQHDRAPARRGASGPDAVGGDGELVSVAGFGGETPNGIRIGPVYTPPELRGRGYATALVAELSSKLLAEGGASASSTPILRTRRRTRSTSASATSASASRPRSRSSAARS